MSKSSLCFVNERGKDSTEMLEFVKKLVVSRWAYWVLHFLCKSSWIRIQKSPKVAKQSLNPATSRKQRKKHKSPLNSLYDGSLHRLNIEGHPVDDPWQQLPLFRSVWIAKSHRYFKASPFSWILPPNKYFASRATLNTRNVHWASESVVANCPNYGWTTARKPKETGIIGLKVGGIPN